MDDNYVRVSSVSVSGESGLSCVTETRRTQLLMEIDDLLHTL